MAKAPQDVGEEWERDRTGWGPCAARSSGLGAFLILSTETGRYQEGAQGCDPVLGPQASCQSSWLSPRVMLVPPEPQVARALLAFRECLVNEAQLGFPALRVTE